MVPERRSQLQPIVCALGLVLCTLGCQHTPAAAPGAEFKGEPMLPNEKHHAVAHCEEHLLSPARVLIEVAIDAQGEPRAAQVTSLGGTVRDAFSDCVQTQLMAQDYASRGKAVTLAAIVDLRIGAFSTAGSPTPIPPNY